MVPTRPIGRFSIRRSDGSTRDRRFSTRGFANAGNVGDECDSVKEFWRHSLYGAFYRKVRRTGAQVILARVLHCKNGGFRPLRFSAHYRSIAGDV
jgi:hypothetical protein